VRDPRAVAFSRSRKKQHPDASGSVAMLESDVIRSARKWVQTNHAVKSLVQNLEPRYRLIKYEDFISAPTRAVETIHAMLGLPAPAHRLIDGRTIKLGLNHTVWAT
jgi:hypothetical protein